MPSGLEVASDALVVHHCATMAALQPVNPYAAPIAPTNTPPGVGGYWPGTGEPEVWNDGGVALCHKGSPWPDRCVRCNAPAEGYRLKRRLYWHPWWVYLTILAGLLVYVVIALVTRKTAEVEIGLCPTHRSRRRMGLAIAWLGVLGAIVGAYFIGGYDPALAFAFASLLLIGAIVTGVVLSRVVRPKRIDDRYAWLHCGAPFVGSLPPAQPGPPPG